MTHKPLFVYVPCANCGTEFKKLRTSKKRVCRDCRKGN